MFENNILPLFIVIICFGSMMAFIIYIAIKKAPKAKTEEEIRLETENYDREKRRIELEKEKDFFKAANLMKARAYRSGWYFNICEQSENYDWMAHFVYIPSRIPDGHLQDEEIESRNFVLAFKEGKNLRKAANLFKSGISNSHIDAELSQCCVIPIPASSRSRHELRFNGLCEELSRTFGLVNGNKFIHFHFDREQKHLRKHSIADLFDHVEILIPDDLHFEHMFVIDDVRTTGRSSDVFLEMIESNCKRVSFIYLAKTVDSDIFS